MAATKPTESFLQKMNETLLEFSFVSGYFPTTADLEFYSSFQSAPDAEKYGNVFRWYENISSFSEKERRNFPPHSFSFSSSSSNEEEVDRRLESAENKIKNIEQALGGEGQGSEKDKAKIKALEEENNQLRYRISHLIRALEREEKENESLKSKGEATAKEHQAEVAQLQYRVKHVIRALEREEAKNNK
eukprot:TRINITY_DN557_c0_g1_i1.p1 TRINITY_DN557_c0_g1~~TRINITY_DN557_c0_g1_i1.p1  ORF type:complete len:189 (+),score=73.28 TRINITY_DN557_c0_g1_i1:94-660(+)